MPGWSPRYTRRCPSSSTRSCSRAAPCSSARSRGRRRGRRSPSEVERRSVCECGAIRLRSITLTQFSSAQGGRRGGGCFCVLPRGCSSEEGCWVLTEFLHKVFWSGPHNTIVCPAGHHIMEGRWLRDEAIDVQAHHCTKGAKRPPPRAASERAWRLLLEARRLLTLAKEEGQQPRDRVKTTAHISGFATIIECRSVGH